MNDPIQNLKNAGFKILNIHPLAHRDVKEMNTILQSRSDYIEGVKVSAHNWDEETNSVEFFTEYPSDLTKEEKIQAEAMLKEVIDQFPRST